MFSTLEYSPRWFSLVTMATPTRYSDFIEKLLEDDPLSSQNFFLCQTFRGRTSKKGQKSGTFTCSHCPFRSAFKFSVKLHEEHHTVRLGFQCSFCTFSAATNVGLKLHVDRVHADQLKVIGGNFWFLKTFHELFCIGHKGSWCTSNIRWNWSQSPWYFWSEEWGKSHKPNC